MNRGVEEKEKMSDKMANDVKSLFNKKDQHM